MEGMSQAQFENEGGEISRGYGASDGGGGAATGGKWSHC